MSSFSVNFCEHKACPEVWLVVTEYNDTTLVKTNFYRIRLNKSEIEPCIYFL